MKNQVMAILDCSKLDLPTQCKHAAYFRNIFDHICLFLKNLKPKHIACEFSGIKERGAEQYFHFLIQLSWSSEQFLSHCSKFFFGCIFQTSLER
jgi:hypothetical protein